MAASLTPHFTEEELGVHGCEERIILNAQFLCSQLLEPIRAQYATPVHVTSGYRAPAKNEQVHGVHESEHLYHDDHAACDFTVPGIPLIQVFNWIRVVSKLPFRQVILERDHVTQEPRCIHISIRRNGNDRHEALVGATNNAEVYHFVECC
jgi:hypothetical protein